MTRGLSARARTIRRAATAISYTACAFGVRWSYTDRAHAIIRLTTIGPRGNADTRV